MAAQSHTGVVPRSIARPLRAALSDTPVVVLNGARQTGKSTLVQEVIAQGYPATYLTLDDAVTLAAARADARGFIQGFKGPIVIDEVQQAPDLFPAIKAAVDRDRRAGRFLLTGSADILLVPRISESLAGRTEILTLWPLSQSELATTSGTFADRMFARDLRDPAATPDLRADVLRRAVAGGYPEAIARAAVDRRAAWFDSYVSTILQRDVRDIAEISRVAALPRLLALLAARSMSLLNMAEVSRAADIPHRTLVRYIEILETIFFIRRIPAWSGNLGRRLTRHPKVLVVDTGLMAHLNGVDLARFEKDPTLAGPLIETFVAAEVMKSASWSATRPRLLHFRDSAGNEVDVILERSDGTCAGIEVKASSTVDDRDFRGLRAFAAATGRKFSRGVVLYTGTSSIPFGPRLWALPMKALWAE